MFYKVSSLISYIFDWIVMAVAIVSYDLPLFQTIALIILAEFFLNVLPFIVKSKAYFKYENYIKHFIVFIGFIYDVDLWVSRPSHYFTYFAIIYLALRIICTIAMCKEKKEEAERNRRVAQNVVKEPVIYRTHTNDTEISSKETLSPQDRKLVEELEQTPPYVKKNINTINKIVKDNAVKCMSGFSEETIEAFTIRVFAEILPMASESELSLTEIDQAAWHCLYDLLNAKISDDEKYYRAAKICENHIDETYIPKQAKSDEPRLSFDKLARRSYIASKISGLLSELLPLCSEKEKEPIFDTLFEWFLEVIDDPRFNDDEFNSAVWGILHHTIRGKRNNPRYSKAVEICEEKIAENFRKETLALYNKEFSAANESEKLFIRILRNDVSQCMQNFSENATEAYVAQAMLFIRTTIGYDYTPEEMTLICWEVLKTIFESDLKENEDFSVPLQVCEKNINMITKG